MATLLCVPIMVEDEPTALRDAAEARDAGADIVEFRIDSFFSGSLTSEGQLDDREVRAILRLVRDSPLPCIVTCRAASEAGSDKDAGYDGEDSARISLYERLGNAGDDTGRSSRRGDEGSGERGGGGGAAGGGGGGGGGAGGGGIRRGTSTSSLRRTRAVRTSARRSIWRSITLRSAGCFRRA
jgi:hypothetical protein